MVLTCNEGISSFIASVLLLAFTITVGVIFSLWFSTYTKIQTRSVNSTTAGLCVYQPEVLYAVQFGSKGFNVTLVNKNDRDLEDIKAIAIDSYGNSEILTVYHGVWHSASALRISGYAYHLHGSIKKLIIYSPSCPDSQAEVNFDGFSGNCPKGMVFIPRLGGFCIFKYEASRSDANSTWGGSSNIPTSRKGVVPWTGITLFDARTACENIGMHLCTNDEWQAATGTSPTDTTCPHGNNYSPFGVSYCGAIESVSRTGEIPSERCQHDPTDTLGCRCLTGTGPTDWCSKYDVCDLNGNVWEWVNNIVYTSEPGNTSTVICWNSSSELDVDKTNHICLKGWDVREDSDGGYVSGWNWTYNYPIKSPTANAVYGNDYFWTWCGGNATGVDCNGYTDAPYGGLGANNETVYQRGVLRGGDWESGEGAGCFDVNLNAAPSSLGSYIGFRCCL